MKTESVLRILDANGNRAREGLRTAEDYIRFSIGEGRWAKRLRVLRHQVTEILQRVAPLEQLLASRRVQMDSGLPVAEQDAHVPTSFEPAAVSLRGLKRAEEAIRVLEEFLRGADNEAARTLSQIRFSVYEAEQWLALCGERARRLQAARLYVLLTEERCSLGLEETARAALRGGAQILQLREKSMDGGRQLERIRRLRGICEEREALLVVNDRLDVAQAGGADGVHVGQSDLSPGDIRRVAGEALLVGRSTHSPEQAKRAVEDEQADYIAVGAMYATRTKAGYSLQGLDLARAVMACGWGVPVFAIGGITVERIPELRRAGIERVAVSAAVAEAGDPEQAAGRIREALMV